MASVAALWMFGFRHEDRVLLVVGTAGVLMLTLALVLSGLGALWLFLHTRSSVPGPLELVVGTPGPTGFEVRTPLWLPLIDVRWTLAAPDARLKIVARGRRLIEQWIPRRRGTPEGAERWFTVGDAFGLMSICFVVPVPRSMRFLPDEGALRQVQVVRGLASGDQFAHPSGRPEGDLQDIRAYGAGDPIRYVLWKVFAKSRTLVVRTEERALSPVRRTAAFLVSGEGDQAAAGTAKTAFECGALGDEWTFGADGAAGVAKERREALEVVLESAHADRPGAGAGLGRFIHEADAPNRVVVFAPALPGPWVDRVLAVARTTKLELVLCTDAVVPSKRSRMAGLVLTPIDEEHPGRVVVDRDTLARLCRRLGGVGTIRVADRKTGQVYGAAHLSKLTGAA